MGKTKPRGKYQSISLSEGFISEIKNHIINDPKYKSIAEFTRTAIREKMNIERNLRMLEFFGSERYKRIMSGESLEDFAYKEFGIKLSKEVSDEDQLKEVKLKLMEKLKKAGYKKK